MMITITDPVLWFDSVVLEIGQRKAIQKALADGETITIMLKPSKSEAMTTKLHTSRAQLTEARRLARDAARNDLHRQGHKPSKLTPRELATHTDAILAKHGDYYYSAAAKMLTLRQELPT